MVIFFEKDMKITQDKSAKFGDVIFKEDTFLGGLLVACVRWNRLHGKWETRLTPNAAQRLGLEQGIFRASTVDGLFEQVQEYVKDK